MIFLNEKDFRIEKENKHDFKGFSYFFKKNIKEIFFLPVN